MVLAKFASFMEQRNADCVTTQLALDWAQQPSDVQPALWAQRLSYVRCFARHHIASDPKTEVPPPSLLPFRAAHAHPYLYSIEEIQRVGESLRSKLDDVDLDNGVLTVRGTKFGKSRLVPIHA